MPFMRSMGSCSRAPATAPPSGSALDGPVGGHEGAGPMVLRPVELDAAGDPGARQADERGLDDVLAVDEVVAVGLSWTTWMRPPISGRIITRRYSFSRCSACQARGSAVSDDAVGEGQRIDPARRALVDALLQEHRVAVRRGEAVGLDDDRLGPGRHRLLALPGRTRGQLHQAALEGRARSHRTAPGGTGVGVADVCVPVPSGSLLTCHAGSRPAADRGAGKAPPGGSLPEATVLPVRPIGHDQSYLWTTGAKEPRGRGAQGGGPAPDTSRNLSVRIPTTTGGPTWLTLASPRRSSPSAPPRS